MTLSESIKKRDAEQDIEKELLQGVNEMLADSPARTHTITQTDVAFARQKALLTQKQFAQVLGVSVRTLESWEQGFRKPSKAAQSLIKLFIIDPEFVKSALLQQ